jgi:cytochrome c2
MRAALPVVSLVALLGCGSSSLPPAPAPAGALYAAWNCGACHGESRQGTELAPSLRRLGASWDEDALTAFLADPDAAVATKPHLQAYRARFPAPMPPFQKAEGERRTLAAWLLQESAP